MPNKLLKVVRFHLRDVKGALLSKTLYEQLTDCTFQIAIHKVNDFQFHLFEDTVLVKRKLAYNLDRTFSRISGLQR
jgi:hypothetical protein